LTNRKAWKSGLIDACKEQGVIPLVRNPLDGGLASGRYTATNPSGGEAVGGGVLAAKYPFSKLEKLQPLHSVHEMVAERASTRVKREVRDMKERYKSARYGPGQKINTDITTTQVAIQYVIAKGAVPICHVTDSQQAEEILGCLGWRLTEDEVDMLDSAADLCGL
jgi:aryl-alcohol dehydrogenase-like predicted oxidoreductase